MLKNTYANLQNYLNKTMSLTSWFSRFFSTDFQNELSNLIYLKIGLKVNTQFLQAHHTATVSESCADNYTAHFTQTHAHTSHNSHTPRTYLTQQPHTTYIPHTTGTHHVHTSHNSHASRRPKSRQHTLYGYKRSISLWWEDYQKHTNKLLAYVT